MMDDIMDNSTVRRGRPCWYLVQNLGTKAINDGFLLTECLFQILRKNFISQPYYHTIVELFHDIILKTHLGQHLDTHTAMEKPEDLNKFTMARYNYIVNYKTSYYSFVFPIALALHMVSFY